MSILQFVRKTVELVETSSQNFENTSGLIYPGEKSFGAVFQSLYFTAAQSTFENTLEITNTASVQPHFRFQTRAGDEVACSYNNNEIGGRPPFGGDGSWITLGITHNQFF